jgi:hypothetical protein
MGGFAGDEGYTDAGSADVLITNDNFEAFDAREAGTLSEGLLFQAGSLIQPGDRVEVKRVDGRSRRYTVEEPLTTGMTVSILPHFKIISIGGAGS